MKIVTYNVNGIRAAMRKGLIEWLQSTDADIVCFQEIKANPEQFDETEFHDIGYKYCYWYPAQKKGYSGVAIISKTKPNHVVYGIEIETMDFEGRNLRLDFDEFSVMCMYLPSGTNNARLEFKLNYMDEFLEYTKMLRETIPNLIVCGDFNICHKPEDIHNPVGLKNVSGFLPVERDWLTSMIDSGFIDSFREFNDQPDNYTWWSYRANARANNKGWRLDYFLVNATLQEKLKRTVILKEAMHSDHCPVLLELETA